MEENNDLRKIQETLDSLPDNFSILEEQIDVDLQMEYFEYARDKKNSIQFDDFSQAERRLNAPDEDKEEKKKLLVRLAGNDKVEAFRIIERFQKKARGYMRKWAVLALQESRMIIQSSLLGEQQVFISTGLGGKGQNIRYFIALVKKDKTTAFSEAQQKIIQTEFSYFLDKSDGELENMKFENEFALGAFLFPLKKNLQSAFKSFLDECNQYGDFLHDDVIITNVKTLSISEIKDFYQSSGES